MPLVEYDEMYTFLDVPNGTNPELVEPLVDEVTALFEKECGRSAAPFGPAQTGRIEIHQAGAGSTVLTLDYPIASITSIVSGRDVALPDETILPSDAATVVWQVGSRELYRVGGGYWQRWTPTWVKVVYNTQADQPGDVKLAIKRVVAGIYNQRGAEGLATVSRGSRSQSITAGFTMFADTDPVWQAALASRRAWFR